MPCIIILEAAIFPCLERVQRKNRVHFPKMGIMGNYRAEVDWFKAIIWGIKDVEKFYILPRFRSSVAY